MIITAAEIEGAFVLDLERREDERGSFARSFCARELGERGMNPRVVQANVSQNRLRGTIRGLHYTHAPHQESKIVRVTRGAIFDVVADVRRGSPTFLRWQGVELDATGGRAIYLPPGVAHGFQSLTDDVEILYLMGDFYDPERSAGVRWNDPALGIRWPLAPTAISAADGTYPDFAP